MGAHIDKLGFACLGFLLPMLNLHSFSALRALYRNPQTLLLNPAFLLFSFNLLALFIITSSITSYPPKRKCLPPTVLQFPFVPINVDSFACSPATQERPRRPRISRTTSCAEFAVRSPPSRTAAIARSSSHNSYLSQHSAPSPRVPTLEDLTDEEANKTFTAFIQSRFAVMKREQLE